MDADRAPGRENLLHEINAAGFGRAQAGRTGDGRFQGFAAQHVLRAAQQLAGLVAYLGEVALVALVYNFPVLDHNQLYRGRANVNT